MVVDMASETRSIVARKKSPRAPSISLEDAVARALAIYARERRHAAPVDVVAQDIGYKGANNGAAMSTLASLRYYGLVERPQDGVLQVVKEVEDYEYTPSEDRRRELLQTWVKTPPVFADLLERFPHGLPSEKSLRWELVQRGFSPIAAESALRAFLRSVEFAGIFDPQGAPLPPTDPSAVVPTHEGDSESSRPERDNVTAAADGPGEVTGRSIVTSSHDRIPVRLPGGRRAWLEIPALFYAADKLRLKAQIDLLLTEDEDVGQDGIA